MFRKIQMDELKKGMKVCALEKDDTGRPSFFMNSLLIKSDADIDAFRGRGYGVAYIQEEYAAGSAGPDRCSLGQSAGPSGLVAGSVLRKTVGFEEEIYRAMSLKDEAVGRVMELLTDIKAGRGVDVEAFGLVVVRMIDSIFRNPEALTCLAWMRDNDDCTFRHSLNSCILSIALGVELGFSRERLLELGMAAVLHDVGKLLLPEGLLNTPGRYTEGEFAEMRTHSRLGADLLMKTRGIRQSAVVVALQHHERMDGNGYPERLSGTRIHEFGRIVCIVDGYDAMTSARPYRKSFEPHEALQLMTFGRNSIYDAGLLQKFIACIGIYPVGSAVELSTGEIAVVRSVNRENPLKPDVLVVASGDGKPRERPAELSLSGRNDLWITGSANPSKFGIDAKGIVLSGASSGKN